MFLRRFAVGFAHSRRGFSSKSVHDLASTITEFNKEMESIFGEPPRSGFAESASKDFTDHSTRFPSEEFPKSSTNDVNEIHSISPQINQTIPRLTHIGTTGEAQMVDVSPKESSKRIATATCKVILGKEVFDLVLANQMAKGDVLGVAKIAGITGAKHTSNLIPLCHNIGLNHVGVDLRLNREDFSVEIKGEASSTGKTGVEMEALTAVTVAGLTVYDMCKAASKNIQITDVRLDRKTGGKSGSWSRDE